MFNIPYMLFFEGGMGIFVWFFYQWIYFAPIFIGSTLLNQFLLRSRHTYHDVPARSYQRMAVWGFLMGLSAAVCIWGIDKGFNIRIHFDLWYRLSVMVGIMSGHIAIGGLVSIKGYSNPRLEGRSMLAIAGIALAFFYVTEQVGWLGRLLR